MATDQKEKDYNPSQEDYEAKFDNASSTSTSGHNSDEAANLSTRESKPDGSHDDVELGPDEQAKIDQMEAGLRENNLYDPSGAQQHHKPSLRNRLKGLANTRGKKAGWIGGGVIGLLLGGFLTLFPVLGPLHIFSNLANFNFEYNDSFRRNRTGSIVRSILNANRNTNLNLRETPFSTKAELIQFEKFQARMQSNGWDFEFENGRAVGLIDPDGTRINLDAESGISRTEFRERIQPLMDDTVPAWRMIKRIQTRNRITAISGFRWTDLFSRSARQAVESFQKRLFLKESGLDDVPTNIDGSRERTQVDVDDNGDPVYGDGNNTGDVIADAQNEILDELDSGSSKSEAITNVRSNLQSRLPDVRSVTLVAFVAGCIAQSVYEQGNIADFARQLSVVGTVATFMLANDEIRQGGDIDVGEVGELFSIYNNDQGTFAASADWQRATGEPVTGEELSPELHVIQEDPGGMTQGVLENIGLVVSGIPGFSSLCRVLDSTFGTILGYVIDGIEIIFGCISSGCLASVGKFAVTEGLFFAMGKLIAASIVNVVGLIADNPVQALGLLNQGFSFVSTEETRTGEPIESSEYNQYVQSFMKKQNEERPLNERYFALENGKSLIAALSRVKMNIKNLSPAQAIASVFNMPGQSLVAATTAQNVYAQTDLDFENYGFQKYTYANNYIDADPYELAEEVTDLIDSDEDLYLENGDDKNTAEEYARDFAVMCMGYVPEQGLVIKKATNENYLPRYSNPETTDADRRNAAFQKICIDEAREFSDFYSKIGRFVDDIEITSAIIHLTGEDVSPMNDTTAAPNTGNPPPPPEETEPEPPPICTPDTPPGVICVP